MKDKTSLALFGSFARGDADVQSDVDILVVSNTWDNARPLVRRALNVGWHPTFFTWDRLAECARNGDPFVRHLQLESRILVDPDDRLSHVLSGFLRLPSYSSRLLKASEVFGALEYLPDHPGVILCLLDIAAVGYRSMAVARLADEGLDCFSTRSIHAGLSRVGALRRSDPDIYRELRRFKWIYRSRIMARPPRRGAVLNMLGTIDRIFRLNAHFRWISPERALADSLGRRAHLGWYARSRQLESVLQLVRSRDCEVGTHLEGIRQALVPCYSYARSVATTINAWESQVAHYANMGALSVINPGAPATLPVPLKPAA